METNPFAFSSPAAEPERFFGRQDELSQVLGRLLSSNHESSCIIGERRIGKTSLLKYLANPEVLRKYGANPDQYCMLFIDLAGAADGITPEWFLQYVMGELCRTTQNVSIKAQAGQMLEKLSLNTYHFGSFLDAIRPEGVQLVMLLDEFESIAGNPNFNKDFYGGLRSLLINKHLAIVTASRQRLSEIPSAGSPFFNVFSPVNLGPFSKEAALEMVTGLASQAQIPLSKTERDCILSLGGRHPFFLQIAGFYLVKGKNENLTHDALIQHTVDQFDREADEHFRYYWEKCPPNEVITLILVYYLNQQRKIHPYSCHLSDIQKRYPRASKNLLASLINRGLVIEHEGSYALFTSRLGDWILRALLYGLDGENDVDADLLDDIKKGKLGNVRNPAQVLKKFNVESNPMLNNLAIQLGGEVASSMLVDFAKIYLIG